MPPETGTRQGRIPPTGDQHGGEGPAEDPPPEGRATQGTHTEHIQAQPHLLERESYIGVTRDINRYIPMHISTW